MVRCVWLWALLVSSAAVGAPDWSLRPTWPATVLAWRQELAKLPPADRAAHYPGRLEQLRERFPLALDWLRQDAGLGATTWLDPATADAADQALLRAVGAAAEPAEPALASYHRACLQRRDRRLAVLRQRYPVWVLAFHGPLGGSHYAYTEAQTDAQQESNFEPGSRLCRLDLRSAEPGLEVLLDSPEGVLRDVDVSLDAHRVLFAWKQGATDDYHLYELQLTASTARALTSGAGVADYEGCYLADGRIAFNSTRCVQTVDCFWTEVSNLYSCAADGTDIQRLAFDQVHDNYPTLTPDGRLLYTRWDYNDRGQVFPQGLFQMNPDGSGQAAVYGNNSWFPTTLAHARQIPGTGQIVAVATGHHSYQPGHLLLLDPQRGREENTGAQLIAPERPTPAVKVDAYGQDGPLFAYPYPLDAQEYVVVHSPTGWLDRSRRGRDGGFGLYWFNRAGERELLVADPRLAPGRAVPLASRQVAGRPSRLAPGATDGAYYIQDIYRGPGLAGVARGSIRSLRVVALEFRAAGIGHNGSSGPAGAAMSSTPVSVGNGCWDPKVILGEAAVQADGSAFFRVPARTPVYFQALDSAGRAVQTMRSWSTVQPGETQSCVGCHESKNEAPAVRPPSVALRQGPQALRGGERPAGFSFPRQVQPILDQHCVRCHDDPAAAAPWQRRAEFVDPARLVALTRHEEGWQYTTTAPPPSWAEPGFDSAGWAAGPGGFGLPGTPGSAVRTLWNTPDIWIRRTFDLPAAAPREHLALWVSHDEDVRIYLNGVLAASAQGFVQAPVLLPVTPSAAATLRAGRNTLAATCHQTSGGQLIDVALVAAPPQAAPARPFSLRGDEVLDPVAKRRWSRSYLALTQARQHPGSGDWRGQPGDPVSWISVQSAPPLLPPYSSGSFQSRLLPLLQAGHGGSRLSPAELRTLATWLDLLVPFCGDYTEAHAWTPAEEAKYQHFLDKRRRLAGP